MRLFTYRAPVLPWSLVLPLEVLRVAVVGIARGAAWLARHPLVALGAVVVAVLVLLAREVGWLALVMTAGVVFLAVGVWAEADPDRFDRWVQQPWRSALRRRLVYRRHWSAAMDAAGLARGGREPRLRRVTSTDAADLVRVTVLPGQTLDDWRTAGPRLAAAFGLRVVRPRKVPGRPHDLELYVRRRGELHTPVAEVEAEPVEQTGGAFRRAR